MTDPVPIEGEPLRYRFPSRTAGDEDHVVDLAANDGNGECSCSDFTFRRGPNYHKTKEIVHYYTDEEGRVGKECTQCWHVHQALLHLATTIAKEAHVVERAKPVTIKKSKDDLPF
jgi:hypothetical protein